jgi:hypothetical protein
MKSIPVWVLLITCIGSVAGAFLYISNIIQTTVDPEPYPVELSGTFDQTPIIDEVYTHVFGYTINDDTQDEGYIVLVFQGSGIGPSNFTIWVEIFGGTTYEYILTQVVSGYPTDDGGFMVTYVFEDPSTGPLDFSYGGTETYGEIWVSITYHVGTLMDVALFISSTSSP